MAWYQGNTPSVVHDKPLQHGGTRMGLLNQREGYGAAAYGGLFADEVKVSSLADSGAGTFREAISTAKPAWITFNQGLSAPARGTWAAPDNNAPLSEYNAANIHAKSRLDVLSGDVTVDGRGSQYGVEGFQISLIHANVIVHNFRVDHSKWWAGGSELSASHTGGLYNVNDPDSSYSYGTQPIQKSIYDSIYRGTWSSSTTYANIDVVTYNGVGYKSKVNNNTNHQPDTSATQWNPEVPSTTGGAVGGTDFGFWRGTWSSASTYQLADGVFYNGLVYVSTVNTNTNHIPSSTSQWTAFDPTMKWKSSTTYSIGDVALSGPSNVDQSLYSSKINSNLNHVPTTGGDANWYEIGGSGPVNGQVYLNFVSLNEMGAWLDHNTLVGPQIGVGSPARSSTWWDFNDGGFSLCGNNTFITYSWNYFNALNKSSIIGCSSSDSTDAGDWVTLSHNWFQGGQQRQPLTRFAHIHAFANYYDNAGLTAGYECIAAESSTQVLYEYNIGDSSIVGKLCNPRTGNAVIKNVGNVVRNSMTIAADQGSLGFTPPYSLSAPDLSTTGTQNTWLAQLTSKAGQH